MKLKQKRTKTVEKIWYILQPFLIYLIAKTFAMLLFSEGCNLLFDEETRKVLASPVNALASLFGVAFVMKDFLIEVAVSGEIDIDAPGIVRFFKWIGNGIKSNKKISFILCLCMVLAITSSLAINIIIELISVQSSKYDNVEAIQYGVPFIIGLILYGIISPWVEEIVFRGLIFNRMKRYYSIIPCVLVNSIMFGGFHANLPQFIYATLMGILISVCYEWTRTFETPILIHMTANIFVYSYSMISGIDNNLISWRFFIIFAVASILLLCGIRMMTNNKK